MNKRSPWDDPNTEELRLLAALEQTRHLCCNSEEVMACARRQHSYALLEAIKEAIDNYAEGESETGSISGAGRTARGASTHDDHRFSIVCRSLSPT